MTLLFSNSAVSKKFSFESIIKREEFYKRIHDFQKKQQKAEELRNGGKKLKVFLGTVNIENVFGISTIEYNEQLIPLNMDLYVFTGQSCKYPIPHPNLNPDDEHDNDKKYYFTNPVSHWCFHIENYLNLKHSSSNKSFRTVHFLKLPSGDDVLIIFASSDVIFDISNLSTHFATSPPPAPVAPLASTAPNQSYFSSLFRSFSNEVKKISIPDPSPSDFIAAGSFLLFF